MPTGARAVFGDLNEDGELRALISSNDTRVLEAHLGMRSQVYYKGLPKEADV